MDEHIIQQVDELVGLIRRVKVLAEIHEHPPVFDVAGGVGLDDVRELAGHRVGDIFAQVGDAAQVLLLDRGRKGVVVEAEDDLTALGETGRQTEEGDIELGREALPLFSMSE